ncbi:MAG: amidohydrolase family protein, partial [Alphaproteobacteria bacterium]
MLRLGLALCVLLSVASPVSGSIQKIADRIYYGGEIITADDARPWAQSVAVGDGRIIGVGPLAEVVRLRGAETELIDLDGRTLAPGFIDACGHLSRTGLQAVTANLLAPPEGHSRSIADIVKVLQQWRQVTFAAREFGLILGFGYDESQFDGARRLIRADLDAVSSELPVIAIHRSGSRSVFNSRALELAGMETAAPEDGERNGVLEGGAHRLALRRVLETLAEQNVTPLIDAAQELYARFGHTTAQDGRPGRAVLNAYSKLAAGGQFKIDVIAYPDAARNGGHALHSAFHSRNYMNGFRIGGMMLRFDGAPQAGAARLTARWPGAMPDGREDGTALFTA